jgi:dTDP-glucose 4,6-dehydratase
MKKIVYVTGCLGFIGSYVTRACLEQGWYVIGVDKGTYAARYENLKEFEKYGPNCFKFINSDINDLTSLFDCDYIINTAAETHVDNSIVSSDEFIHSNINGVKHLLDLIRLKSKFTMPTLLHFSTDEVYGDIKEGSHTETDLLKPSNPYSATKAAADMLITAWGRTFKVPYIIVRPTNNYGIGQYPEKLVPKVCKFINLGKKVPLHNNGTPKRVWLHAKDTANAVITIIKNNENNECLNEIYNIGGDIELPNIEIVEKVHKLLISPSVQSSDWKDEICDFNYTRAGQDVRYSLDDNKLRKLGWKNECNLDTELQSIVEFYKNNFIW